MTEQSAIHFLAQRAARLNWPTYDWEFKHYLIKPNDQLIIDGIGHLYILISMDSDMSVESEMGYYGFNNKAVSELTEEHTGRIVINNRAPYARYVRFLQGIPHNPQ